MSVVAVTRPAVLRGELLKLSAFVRRDFLVAISYRLPFIADWVAMLLQVVVFEFVGKLVNPEALGTIDGQTVSYLEFVTVGIALSSFTGVALGRMNSAMRQEQVQGTIESLLLTPTAFGTIQLGSVVYDLIYVPIRMLIFFGLTALVFGASFHWAGFVPVLGVLAVYVPFVWGLGIMAASWTLTFKRGTGFVGMIAAVLTLGSGAYFPISVLPSWAQPIADILPTTIALNACREALLGDAGWSQILPDIAKLVPWAVVSLALGVWSFRWAFERERRQGTLGLY